jgi:hypothetical protein
VSLKELDALLLPVDFFGLLALLVFVEQDGNFSFTTSAVQVLKAHSSIVEFLLGSFTFALDLLKLDLDEVARIVNNQLLFLLAKLALGGSSQTLSNGEGVTLFSFLLLLGKALLLIISSLLSSKSLLALGGFLLLGLLQLSNLLGLFGFLSFADLLDFLDDRSSVESALVFSFKTLQYASPTLAASLGGLSALLFGGDERNNLGQVLSSLNDLNLGFVVLKSGRLEDDDVVTVVDAGLNLFV